MLPDVPTLHELGFDYDQTSWRCIVVNKDTPDAIVAKLAEAFRRAMETPELKKSADAHWEPLAYLPPAETQKFLESELGFYKDLTMKLGIHYSQRK